MVMRPKGSQSNPGELNPKFVDYPCRVRASEFTFYISYGCPAAGALDVIAHREPPKTKIEAGSHVDSKAANGKGLMPPQIHGRLGLLCCWVQEETRLCDLKPIWSAGLDLSWVTLTAISLSTMY